MTAEQSKVCGAVARQLGIPKKKIHQEAESFLAENENSSVVELKEFVDFRFAVSKETLGIGKIIIFKYFEKSELYSDIANNINNADVHVTAFSSGGEMLAAYEAREYSGLGGIFVRSSKSGNGIVVELLKNYLEVNYPKQIVD
jgi:hypothetical protein